ncbi:hypothetical protein D9611_003685 [Ephemerocybe angulata]|uniref:BTB domain-containing protein n=1 Tax=Ephemerocybe angulata TaxID=980116 RepID=A0A8H5B5Y6_9AGAR|nr:hypothetical protein D9611_003685 [Tulosesus angulatus]
MVSARAPASIVPSRQMPSLCSSQSRRHGPHNSHAITCLVEGHPFSVPLSLCVAGSKDFAARNYTPCDIVALPGATVDDFRAFLRFLLPVSTASTHTNRFCKQDWLSILKLSTLWRFNDARKAAIEKLDEVLEDPFEFVALGKAHYVRRWLMTGYAFLAMCEDVIAEKDSGIIGHLSTVRIYIIRHSLQSWDGCRPFPDFLDEQLGISFSDEFSGMDKREASFKTDEDIRVEKDRMTEGLIIQEERDERIERETKIERRRSNEARQRRRSIQLEYSADALAMRFSG